MPLTWPAGLVPRAHAERLISPGTDQVSPLTESMQIGGSAVVLRQVSFDFPPVADLALARQVRSILDQARQDRVILPMHQPGFVLPTVGAITVNAAASAGKTLAVAGLPTSLALAAGQYLSVSTGGQWYLYALAADSPAGSANRTLSLTSAKRAAHATGHAVALSPAMIEGWIVEGREISVDTARLYGFSISVREAR